MVEASFFPPASEQQHPAPRSLQEVCKSEVVVSAGISVWRVTGTYDIHRDTWGNGKEHGNYYIHYFGLGFRVRDLV